VYARLSTLQVNIFNLTDAGSWRVSEVQHTVKLKNNMLYKSLCLLSLHSHFK